MYRGKRTLFYNGEELLLDEDENFEFLIYNEEERETWQAIIVLPGVEVIPWNAFMHCENVEVVIMAHTVKRIETFAFVRCKRLKVVKLSTNLEYIGDCVFWYCKSLTSVFIPPSCREIGHNVFVECTKLIILCVPQHTELGVNVVGCTALIKASPFGCDSNHEEVNHWIKNQNMTQDFVLHRACSSFDPTQEMVYGIVKHKGLDAFQMKNAIGITPLQYLQVNPFAEIDQTKMITRYILEMMGEVV